MVHLHERNLRGQRWTFWECYEGWNGECMDLPLLVLGDSLADAMNRAEAAMERLKELDRGNV